MDVSVLTVTWNSVEHIVEQIGSVKEAGEGLMVEELIADNGSNDGTVTKVRQNFSNLPFFVFEKNLGFGAACNELARHASGKYLLLLNPDMKLLPGSLKKLVDFMDAHPSAGAVGGHLFDEQGKTNIKTTPRRFPLIWDQLAILLKLPHLFPKIIDRYLARDLDLSHDQIVDSVQGSCLMVRREVCEKLGRLFDPRFFIWFEDVDLCREIRRLGLEVWYTNILCGVDFSGQSFKKQKLFWKQRQYALSAIEYFKKWYDDPRWLILAAAAPFTIFAAYIHDLFYDSQA